MPPRNARRGRSADRAKPNAAGSLTAFLRRLNPVTRVALAVAIVGAALLMLTYTPPLRGIFDRARPSTAASVVREAAPSVEPTPAVATPAPPPPSPTFGLPVRLKIPKLGVDAAVEQVGVGTDGAMAAPKGPALAGWYKMGTRPGERGSAVIDGHSGYRGGRAAIFDNLKKLVAGDTVVVVDEAGTSISFVVSESRLLKPDADTTEIFAREDGRFLNLITCTGDWDAAASTHAQRLVVFAVASP